MTCEANLLTFYQGQAALDCWMRLSATLAQTHCPQIRVGALTRAFLALALRYYRQRLSGREGYYKARAHEYQSENDVFKGWVWNV
jgi:hypothetical protein